MTWRSVLLGLTGAAFVSAYTHFNDYVICQTLFIGNHLPYSVYGTLIIFLITINPLIYYVCKRFAFTGRELAVALTLTLAACVVPGSGLMTTFTTSIMMPHHLKRTEPGWKEHGVIEMVPKKMLADVSTDESTRLGGFVQGLSDGQSRISLSDIPWGAWTRTFAFWLPLILSLWVGLIALAVIAHRQWSEHEHLPYPIAEFARSLLPAEGGAWGAVFRNKTFLIGLGIVLVIHLNNYTCKWFPSLIQIPTFLRLGGLRDLFPIIDRAGAWWFFYPRIFFTVVAFAYFLTTSVSFSLGIGAVVRIYLTGILVTYGISLGGGGYFSPGPGCMLTAGAYIGLLAVTIYTGRHYYGLVMRRTLGLKAADPVESTIVWAGRIFLGAMLVFIINLIMAGLDWQIATFYALIAAGIFFVMSRITAETGMFFVQPLWAPCMLLVGIFGVATFGPRTLAIMFMISAILFLDPREALMPFITNALKILDLKKIPLGKPAMLFAASIVVALTIAIPVTLYFQYNNASHMTDRFGRSCWDKAPFKGIARAKVRLEAQGQLEVSESRRGFARLSNADFNGWRLLALGVSIVLVVGFSIARWRLPWWPIHPILFLTWHGSAPNVMSFSLLLGCLVKYVVVRYGGDKLYQKGKPFMFGMIAGDMLGAIIPSIIGFIYYMATGELPKNFKSLMPG